MLVKGNELNRKAYMMSAPAAAALTSLHSGMGIALNDAGEVILCAGTTRGFVALSDKNTVKDNVTDKGGIVSYAVGPAVVTVDADSFDDTETYAFGTLLKYVDGVVTPFETGVDDSAIVSGVALGPVVDNKLRFAQL